MKLLNLPEAKQAAEQAGGGWRLPAIDELFSLVEANCEHPSIDTAIFPDVKEDSEGAAYWTVSEVPGMARQRARADIARVLLSPCAW